MKERANELIPNSTHGFWLDNKDFFRRGQTNRWRSLLDAADLERYDARVTELASPELAAWAEHGWLGAPDQPVASP